MGVGGLATSAAFSNRTKAKKTKKNPKYDPNKTFITSSGKKAGLNPRVFTNPAEAYPTARSGSPHSSAGAGGGGGLNLSDLVPGGVPGGLPTLGGGGTSGLPTTTPGFDPLSIEAKPSPEMQESKRDYKDLLGELEGARSTEDPYLTEQIDNLRERMSTDPTERAIDRAAGASRSFAAGLGEAADIEGARTGRGPGGGAGAIGESAQRATARSASDIALQRERDLDALVLGGSEIMGAPSQREQTYSALSNQLYSLSPYATSAELGLREKGLGLDAYLGQVDADTRRAEAQARIYGSPLDWYQMVLGAL